MPQLTYQRAKVRQTDFSGGQNSGDDAHSLKENQAELLENCIIRDRGKCRQREGLTRVGDNPDTLVAHWTFDNSTAVDDKGDNDGTASSITFVAGKFGKAASFNGTTSSISVPADTTINATDMGPFRLSAWIYADSDGENDEGRIFDKFSGTDVGYRLFVKAESAGTVKLDFEVGHATTNTRVVTSTTLTTGAWNKVDAIYNSDKSGDIYINGVIASYSTDTTGVDGLSDDSAVLLYLGNNSAGTRTFDGELDDLRIYDGAFAADDVEIDQILGLHRYTVGGAIDTLVRVKDTQIQRLSADFKEWTNISGATSFTADTTMNFVQANDILFAFNGTDNTHSLNSSLAVTDEGNTNTDVPRGTCAEWAPNNRLFVSGSLSDADRDFVYFSNALAPQTFDRATNVFKVRSGAGGRVKWLKMFKDFELIIYKNDSIYVLNMDGTTPLTDWNLKALSIAVGCPAGRTVQDIGNDHIFLANDGVRLLSRTTFDKLRVGVISDPIQDIMDTINQDAIQNSCSWFENGYYILGVPTGTATQPDRFLIWDSVAAARNGDPNTSWTVLPKGTWNLSCFTAFGFGDNTNTIVGGDSRNLSLCYKVLTGNSDNGDTITQKITTRELDFGDPFIEKIYDPTQFVGNPGQNAVYAFYISLDRATFVQLQQTMTSAGLLQTPFTTPTVTIAGTEFEEVSDRTKFAGRGNSARFQIINSTYNTNPEFHELTSYARPYGGRI